MTDLDVSRAPGSVTWIPGRGDYGADNVGDMIALIEDHNCVHGCELAGTRAQQAAAGGPGGYCPILGKLLAEEPMPELDPRDEGPHCRARIPTPPPPAPVRRGPRPPKNVPPLFDLPEGN